MNVKRIKNEKLLIDLNKGENIMKNKITVDTETDKSKKKELIVAAIFILTAIILALVPFVIESNHDTKNFQNKWTVINEEQAVVTASQIEKSGRYPIYTAYLTIQTDSGKTGTFASEIVSSYEESEREPIAGLSVGDSCKIYKKQYTGKGGYNLKEGDTAWFINDEIVFAMTEEEMADKYLKDFE